MTLDEIDEIDKVATWAKYMKISSDTAYDLAASGVWPAFKFGRFVRIRKSEMLKRIEEMERDPDRMKQLQAQYSEYWENRTNQIEEETI